MHGLTVRQQDNAKIAAFHLFNFCPATDSPIRLNVFPLRRRNDA